MKVLNQNSNTTTFKRIQLSQIEQEKTLNLLKNLADEVHIPKYEKIKIQLFDIFDKHIQNEVNKHNNIYISKEDFLQTVYLKFFELVENIKEKLITPQNFFEELNNIKPDKNDRQGQEISIDKPINNNSEKNTIKDYLTEENVPIYSASRTDNEKKIIKETTNRILKKAKMKTSEEEVIAKRAEGMSYDKIAEDIGKSRSTVRKKALNGIAKIQKKNKILPEQYRQYALILKTKYKFEKPLNDIVDFIVNNAFLIEYDLKKICENIEKNCKYLNISETEFLTLAFKESQLFVRNPENTKNKIKKISEILKIKPSVFIKIALQNPCLFCYSAATFKKRIKEYSELFNTSEEQTIKVLLKAPQLFYRNPETIKNNIINSSKSLNISEEKFLKFGLRNPRLLGWRPENINAKIEHSAKLFGISIEEARKEFGINPQLIGIKIETLEKKTNESAQIFDMPKEDLKKLFCKKSQILTTNTETCKSKIKETAENIYLLNKEYNDIVMKCPQLISYKPETIINNLEEIAKSLCISKKDIVKAAKKHPFVLASKPETLKNNAEKLSILLNIPLEEIVQIFLKQPQILFLKAESVKNNITNSSKILNITEDIFIDAALRHPSLLGLRPETIKKNITETVKLLNITEQEGVNMALKNPVFLTSKPETIQKKANICLFHQKVINSKPLLCYNSNSEEILYSRTLAHYIKKNLSEICSVNKDNYLNKLKLLPEINLTFDLPEDKISSEFILFVKDFFKKNNIPNKCEFKINGKRIN